jgi:allantoinase
MEQNSTDIKWARSKQNRIQKEVIVMFDLKVQNGILVSGDGHLNAHLYIKNGKVAAITNQDLEADVTIDCNGKYVLPGGIDVHIHSRDPGLTYKEDFYHSTMAAAAGGITTVFEMPNVKPLVSSVEIFNSQVQNLTSKAFVDFGLWGICLGQLNNSELRDLAKAGVIGLKFYWGLAINSKTCAMVYNYEDGMEDIIGPFSDGEVYEIFEEAAKTSLPLAIHAESHQLMRTLTKRVAASGRRDYQALLDSRPNLAEEIVVKTGISFSKATGARLHILHISTGETIELLREAQRQGLPVTGETCPIYLFFDADDYEKVGTTMKVYPPVKYAKDREMIWQGVDDGTISLICSDHAPHSIEEKQVDLFEAPAGMCGVETTMPLLLTEVNRGRLSLSQVVQLIAEKPAKLFNVYPQKGSLQIGSDADFVIVDMDRKTTIQNEKLHSKNPLTVFHGFDVHGMPVQTYVRGNLVCKDGEIIGKPAGKLVKPLNVLAD